MRTKTMLVSALLGTIGSVAVMAQSNVYSLNVVGYCNVTIPSGYSILTCPLNCSPDNTLNTLLPNTNGQYFTKHVGGLEVFTFSGGAFGAQESTVGTAANASGWSSGGADISILPGSAVFIQNTFPSAITATFVGQVPTGTQTQTLPQGYSLIGSIIPVTGDLVTNSISTLTTGRKGDAITFWDPVAQTYGITYGFQAGQWATNGVAANPVLPNAVEGFFYYVGPKTAGSETWTENFSL